MKKNLKHYLKNYLNAEELSLVPSSFDVVGDKMVFSEFPKGLSKKEKIIGQVILNNYHNIKTVLKKTKKYSGRFRTAKLRIIAGEKKKETVCRENNVQIKLDVERVYYSPRMSSERKRVSELVKPNEKVLVMFSGCAPYPLVIAKNSKSKAVIGIEVNPVAHEYALHNVKMNKLEGKIRLYFGDVKKVLPKIKERFDRILMPLPKGAEDFLSLTLSHIKNHGIVHFYDFVHENEINKSEEKVKMQCELLNKKCRILNIVKCGQYSPGFYRVCVDFVVN